MLEIPVRGREAEIALARKVLHAHEDNDRVSLLLSDLCEAVGAARIVLFRINILTRARDRLTLYSSPSPERELPPGEAASGPEAATRLIEQAERDLGGWEPLDEVRLAHGPRDRTDEAQPFTAWVQLPAGHPYIWCLGAIRAGASGPFADDYDAQLVRSAWTTLLITESRRGYTSADTLDSSSWALTRTLPIGIAMVDAEREILYCNETMQDLIAHKDALDIRGNRLIALREEDDQMLGALVRRVASGDDAASKRSFMALARPAPRSAYGVAVERASPQTGDTPVITIQISEPDRGLELSRVAIRAFFGLTPTEAEIAARLADGDDIGEIAAALDIRPGTVRVHLRSIYRKTRVTRQGELVRLVLCSVARFSLK